MTIQTWFSKSGITQTRAASLFGVSGNYLCEVLAKKKAPSKELAAQISAATGGAVTVAELLYPDGVPEGAVMVPPDEGVSVPVDNGSPAENAGDSTIREGNAVDAA